jgi:hypothetical protein
MLSDKFSPVHPTGVDFDPLREPHESACDIGERCRRRFRLHPPDLRHVPQINNPMFFETLIGFRPIGTSCEASSSGSCAEATDELRVACPGGGIRTLSRACRSAITASGQAPAGPIVSSGTRTLESKGNGV